MKLLALHFQYINCEISKLVRNPDDHSSLEHRISGFPCLSLLGSRLYSVVIDTMKPSPRTLTPHICWTSPVHAAVPACVQTRNFAQMTHRSDMLGWYGRSLCCHAQVVSDQVVRHLLAAWWRPALFEAGAVYWLAALVISRAPLKFLVRSRHLHLALLTC